MILTVTLNPLLERRLTYNNLINGNIHRNGKLELKAGGKGINVSRQLNNFNIDNLALTFIGGNSGKALNEILHSENIKLISVRTKSETRAAAIIIDESGNNVTTYFEESPDISLTEANEFLSKLEKMIPNYEMIVFSGSSPCVNTNHIFPAAIEISNKLDKISVCDTYGAHLQNCIDAQPTILHNNVIEIEHSLNVNLISEKDKLDILDLLYSKNIKQAFITDGANPFYCSNFNFHFKVTNPVINAVDSTGSGDAFTAGIIYGWQNDFTFEESLSFASACGAINAATLETCRVNINEIDKVRKDVVISPIGKKMKLVDVTPH